MRTVHCNRLLGRWFFSSRLHSIRKRPDLTYSQRPSFEGLAPDLARHVARVRGERLVTDIPTESFVNHLAGMRIMGKSTPNAGVTG
jgi:hypothetical protein